MCSAHQHEHTNRQPGTPTAAPTPPAPSVSSVPSAASVARPPDRLRIAVIGGSLSGPTVALLLAQAGFVDIGLYEAMPASAGGRAPGGGLISLEHSSLSVLDQLGIGQHEYVHVPSETIWQTPVQGRVLGEPTRRRYPGRFTTWTQLHRALTRRIPHGMAHMGVRITGLTTRGGRPLLHVADGHAEPADIVVFADGRASTGRTLLDPDRRLRYAAYVGHRGTLAHNPGDPLGIVDFWRLEPGPGAQFNIAPEADSVEAVLDLQQEIVEHARDGSLYSSGDISEYGAVPAHVRSEVAGEPAAGHEAVVCECCGRPF